MVSKPMRRAGTKVTRTHKARWVPYPAKSKRSGAVLGAPSADEVGPAKSRKGPTPKRLDGQDASMFNRRDSMHTYLTKTVGDMTIVYYKHPRLGDCHVAYYTE